MASSSSSSSSSSSRYKQDKDPSTILIKNFALQRAVQTLLFYLEQMDGCRFSYLESFQGHQGISRYHGFAGLRVAWNEYLSLLLRDQPFEIEIKKPMKRQGTPGNPFVEQKYFTYKESVDPSKVARQLLEVHSQVCAEIIQDLRLFERENEELLRVYKYELHQYSGSPNDKNNAPVALLSSASSIICDHDPAFNANSPLRGGTYDLLTRMATWFAVQQFVNGQTEGSLGSNSSASRQRERDWLTRFMTQKEGLNFTKDGVPMYRVSETFLIALMSSPPVMISLGEAGPDSSTKPAKSSTKKKASSSSPSSSSRSDLSFIEPFEIAVTLMKTRKSLAEKWKQALDEISQDHISLQRELLQEKIL